MSQIRFLINRLNELTKAYDEGHPEVEDKVWDDMYFELTQLEKLSGITYADSPTQKISYEVVNGLKKVQHNHPMLSLDKTKDIEDILDFAGSHDLIGMLKLDGLTCSLRYADGKLVSAETRGNGIVGEDVTHNIIHVQKVPLTIPVKDEVIIDGEIVCTYQDFEQFQDEYANPRNFASGSIRLLDAKECENRKLTFIAWDCIKGIDKETLSEKLSYLNSNLGFYVVPWLTLEKKLINLDNINNMITLLQSWSKNEQIPIDGIVFKYDNCEYYDSLGATGHHFRGGLAYKFYDGLYNTILRDIEWSMGRTGILTPIAVFKPVDDGESTIEKASLHNITVMQETLGPKPFDGQKIKIYKANAIIPQVYKDSYENNEDDYFAPPIECPICGGRTSIVRNNGIENLVCTNSACEGKFINQLDHFCGKKGLDIKGLSKATLQKLIDLGWLGNTEEIFSLKNFRDEWIKLPGFGVKSVDNILEAIEQSKDCEMSNFIAALGIPLIGLTYAKEICKHEETWTDFKRDIEDGFDFSEWDGFGYEMNKAIYNYDYFEADRIGFDILNLKNSLFNNKKENINLDGKKICITGSLKLYKNRGELTQVIESYGGKVVSSVSKNTDILINNDIESNSSKNQAAKKLNIPIVDEETFQKKYLT